MAVISLVLSLMVPRNPHEGQEVTGPLSSLGKHKAPAPVQAPAE